MSMLFLRTNWWVSPWACV